MDIYHVWCKLKHPAGLISMLFLLSAHTSAQQTITFPSLDTTAGNRGYTSGPRQRRTADRFVFIKRAGAGGEYGEICAQG